MTAEILRLTDGTTTIDLMDAASGYGVVWQGNRGGYAPEVSNYAPAMNHSLPYPPVDDTIELKITGSSRYNCRLKVQELGELLARAVRWSYQDAIAPVLIEYKPEGASNTFQSVLLGLPSTGQMLQVPDTYDLITGVFQLSPVVIRFSRLGIWNDITSGGNASAGGASPRKYTVTIGGNDIFSPLDLTIPNLTNIQNGPADIFIAISDETDKFHFWEAESVSDTFFTSHADATASNGNVQQVVNLTAATTAILETNCHNDLDANLRRYAFFVTMENATNQPCKVKVTGYTGNASQQGTDSAVAGRTKTVSASSGKRTVPLGEIHMPARLAYWKIEFEFDNNSTGNLEVDTVMVVGIDESVRLSRVTRISSTPGRDKIKFLHKIFDEPEPLVLDTDSSDNTLNALPTKGDKMLLAQGSNAIVFIFGNTSGDWTIQNTSNTKFNLLPNVIISKGWLVPS